MSFIATYGLVAAMNAVKAEAPSALTPLRSIAEHHPKRIASLNELRLTAIRDARSEGHDLDAIARALGVTRRRVQQLLAVSSCL